MTIRYRWQAAILFGFLAPHAAAGQTPSSLGDTVWVAGPCTGGPNFRIEVGYADVTIYGYIYRTDVTICRRQRSEIPQSHWKFAFTPTVRLSWPSDSTAPGESVSGDIWQTGGESDTMLLAVSFVAHNRILVNTIHVAPTWGFSTATPIVDGIVLRTMMLPPRGTGPRRRP
jgi:hypothetical protein